jgi:GTPase SAR1 family protein
VRFSEVIQFVKPEYVYLKLTPSHSIRNNGTHKIAKAIASLYKNAVQNIKKEEDKLVKVLGKEFVLGTKYSYSIPCKVSYYIYIEKKKVEFYFIIPKQHQSFMKEKISDVWTNITIKEVKEIPSFGEEATKYQMVYTKEDALSLAVDRRDNELLRSNMNVIDVLEEGDRVGVFYNFIPISQFSWRSSYESTMKKVKNKSPVDRNKMGISYLLLTLVSFVSSLANDIAEVLAGKKSKDEQFMLLQALERMNSRNQVDDSTQKKGSDTILDTQIVVCSESENKLRRINNGKSMAQSFVSINGDNSLKYKSYKKEFNPLSIRHAAEVNKMGTLECQNFISLAGRELLEQYDFIEKIQTQETQVPEDLQKGTLRIGMNKFRGNDQEAYLSTDKEYKHLTLVLIGPTRAGKSTLIGNLSHDAIRNDECVIIFDYIKNCELSEEVSELFSKDQVLNIECDDFYKLQGLGYNEIGFSEDVFKQYDNAKRQTTQLMTLVNSINTDDTRLTAKMERYLTSASLVVFINGGSIRDVFNVMIDHQVRFKYLNRVPKNQKENMREYVLSLQELDEFEKDNPFIPVGTKTHLIVGIIDRLNKLKANTYMELMLKKGTDHNLNLVDELQKNQLICIKMPENMFSTDSERDVYTTYWITKLWLALQVRGQKIKDRNKLRKVNLVIDELYQVQNTEKFLTEKLSRLAKFGLKPIISCHYLNQIKHIREELRSANASYMLISGCDKNNYNELKDELYPFTLEDLMRLPRFHSMNLIKNNDGYGRFITKLPKPIA